MSKDIVKVVIVGDGAVGKTSLLISFALNKFPEDYVPTVFENYNASMVWQDKFVSLGLWDTAGQEEYDLLRPLSYPETDVFLVAFSLKEPDSLENAVVKWVPEIRSSFPPGEAPPILLVGLMLDMREDPQVLLDLQRRKEQETCDFHDEDTQSVFSVSGPDGVRLSQYKPVTQTLGRKVAKQIKAAGYVEASAKTNKGVKAVFEKALEVVLGPNELGRRHQKSFRKAKQKNKPRTRNVRTRNPKCKCLFWN